MSHDHDEKDAKGELPPLPKPFRAQGQQIAADRDVHAFCDLWERGQVLAFAKACVDVAVAEAVAREREACAVICDEMCEHWCAYKDTALLNGDVELSNVASGEPRAAEALAGLIRARSTQPDAATVECGCCATGCPAGQCRHAKENP